MTEVQQSALRSSATTSFKTNVAAEMGSPSKIIIRNSNHAIQARFVGEFCIFRLF